MAFSDPPIQFTHIPQERLVPRSTGYNTPKAETGWNQNRNRTETLEPNRTGTEEWNQTKPELSSLSLLIRLWHPKAHTQLFLKALIPSPWIKTLLYVNIVTSEPHMAK
ncbi:hypothetical protein L596_020412 [Steinernema carpocapsae]|uniref:Uncharacterized protein n=1 Tax=Steinernema carpocapsae TaxID=34508 RepID=A0A4U5MTG6_STECR|nr:hypothetical protein L596_020412 [Steinernema carpocapsae]